MVTTRTDFDDDARRFRSCCCHSTSAAKAAAISVIIVGAFLFSAGLTKAIMQQLTTVHFIGSLAAVCLSMLMAVFVLVGVFRHMFAYLLPFLVISCFHLLQLVAFIGYYCFVAISTAVHLRHSGQHELHLITPYLVTVCALLLALVYVSVCFVFVLQACFYLYVRQRCRDNSANIDHHNAASCENSISEARDEFDEEMHYVKVGDAG